MAGSNVSYIKERFSKAKGVSLAASFRVWHWPIMILVGYEYGTSYWGYPVTDLAVLCHYDGDGSHTGLFL